MNGDVKPEELNETFTVSKTKEIGKVPRIIFRRVNGRKLAFAKDVTVYAASNVGKFGDAVGM